MFWGRPEVSRRRNPGFLGSHGSKSGQPAHRPTSKALPRCTHEVFSRNLWPVNLQLMDLERGMSGSWCRGWVTVNRPEHQVDGAARQRDAEKTESAPGSIKWPRRSK